MNIQNSAPVITIDGPSGSGKGTVCQQLAEKLGFSLLDSGALYRLIAVAADFQCLSVDDELSLAQLAVHLNIRFKPSESGVRAYLDNRDVTHLIRQEKASLGASMIAALPGVRKALLSRQRAFQKLPGLVADGRDMGTTVFPDALLKIFLTATAEERAERRYRQLLERGESANLRHFLRSIRERDNRDVQRTVSPLKPAKDAVLIDSTKLSVDQVVQRVSSLFQERTASRPFAT